jgi:hypothetical protein
MDFEWDEDKARTNALKHGITFEEAQTVFDDPLAVIYEDPLHSMEEERFQRLQARGEIMRNISEIEPDSDLLDEYDLSKLKGVRGKYAGRPVSHNFTIELQEKPAGHWEAKIIAFGVQATKPQDKPAKKRSPKFRDRHFVYWQTALSKANQCLGRQQSHFRFLSKSACDVDQPRNLAKSVTVE